MAGSIMLLPSGDLEGLQLVGSGGFGLVYRGRSKMLSMEVALKMIQGSNSSNLARFMRDLKKERDVMQKASNPHVLRLIGVYEKLEGNLIEHGLVMEYMPYGSLRSLFDNIPDVPWALRFQILHQVGLGMNYLHSLDPPIIHRDLKPSNVLLSRHLDAQITDFGLSKIVGATSSVAPSFAGTLSYMPPEALNDINYYSARSFDVYSYGILTWTMFSCEEPYPGIPLAVIQRCVVEGQRPRASVLDQYSNIRMVPEVKELMIRCWNQNADNRPSFHDCSESTSLMFEAYTDEVVDAVRRVQDFLCKTSYQDESTVTFEHSSISLEDFLKDLENAQKDELEVETSSVDEKTEEKDDKNDNMLLPSEAVEDDDKISSTEAYLNNIATSITSSGDYKKIMKKLHNNGLLTKKEQEKLNSSQSLKDLGSTARKVIVTKYKDDPKTITSIFKKMF